MAETSIRLDTDFETLLAIVDSLKVGDTVNNRREVTVGARNSNNKTSFIITITVPENVSLETKQKMRNLQWREAFPKCCRISEEQQLLQYG